MILNQKYLRCVEFDAPLKFHYAHVNSHSTKEGGYVSVQKLESHIYGIPLYKISPLIMFNADNLMHISEFQPQHHCPIHLSPISLLSKIKYTPLIRIFPWMYSLGNLEKYSFLMF